MRPWRQLAVRDSIRAVQAGYDLPLASGLALEAALFGLACASGDKAEGTRAFLEKRAAAVDAANEPRSPTDAL